MTEFDKWWENRCSELQKTGLSPHAFVPDGLVRMGWKAALQWIKRELHAARDGFEPDLGLHNLLRRELGKEYKEAEK